MQEIFADYFLVLLQQRHGEFVYLNLDDSDGNVKKFAAVRF